MNYKLFYSECSPEFMSQRWELHLNVAFIHNDVDSQSVVTYRQYAIVDEEKASFIKLKFPSMKFYPIEE